MTRLAAADLDRLKEGLTRALDDWVPRRFPGVAADGRQLWRMYNLDGGAGTGLVINRTGARAGSWHDFFNHAHGSVLDLWMAAIRESDFRKACAEAARYLGDPATLAALEAAPDRPQRERAATDEAEKRRRMATRLFLEARPLAGSPAERYLIGRGLRVGALPRPPGALRFHPGLRCPETFRETGLLRPAMVAMVTGAAGAQIALHRTFLDILPDGRVTKARDMRKAKQSFGPVGGGFIPLSRGGSGRRWPDMPEGEPVHVTEGIEDGLAVALCAPAARVVAAISMDNIAALPVPPSGAGLVLCAQNDRPETLESFARVAEKARARMPALVVRPPQGRKDWADWAQALAACDGAPPLHERQMREVCA